MVIVTVPVGHSDCDRRAISQGAWKDSRWGQGKKGQHLATGAAVHSTLPVWIQECEWP